MVGQCFGYNYVQRVFCDTSVNLNYLSAECGKLYCFRQSIYRL